MIVSPALTLAEVLSRAADLIEPEGSWTQNKMARAADGYAVAALNPSAVCFCALGAIRRAGGYDLGDDAADFLTERLLYRSVPVWNDAFGRTQAEVVAKLREAAAKAREQGL